MKLVDLDNPVRASWLADQGSRLDPGPYISDTYAARMTLNRVPRTDLLEDVTSRIFRPGISRRSYTHDKNNSVPFLGSADILEADLSFLPLITRSSFDKIPDIRLDDKWILVTRSGMNAGRVTYSRPEMQGSACSEHVLRIIPGESIRWGYLYTFLASRYGTAMIKGGIYGSSIKHIEPPHLMDIPVPRLGNEIEGKIDALINEAMQLRSQFQSGVVAATRDLFKSVGLADLLDYNWHAEPADTGFEVRGLTQNSLRALNYSPRAQRLMDRIRSVPHRTLGDICLNGLLGRGPAFRRVESHSTSGVKLVAQRQAFWMHPEGKWISKLPLPESAFVKNETMLVAARGTLGENEVYGRLIYISKRWTPFAYSGDFLRIQSGDPEVPNPYIFAFLRSESAFRLLRSMATGGKQQDIHERLRNNLPVPICNKVDRQRIAEIVRVAYRARDEAEALEDKAMVLLEQSIREAAR